MSQRILVTGAAGAIGTMLRPRLARTGRTLRLLDVAPLTAGPGEEVRSGSVSDLDLMVRACADVDVVLHLGGHSREAAWADILEHNINGTYTVLEAARRAGAPRVVFASSNHAVGFRPVDEPAGEYLYPRPDTYYGVSKAAGEALGSLYHDRYGLDVICLRIGSCAERPWNERGLATWLSPDDCARLMEASISVPSPGFRVVWGISANTRASFSLAEARALGYAPQDDAEVFAAEMPASEGLDKVYLGGDFCAPSLDAAWE
jgi:nucleoside-diphosphate-sugar epimerase